MSQKERKTNFSHDLASLVFENAETTEDFFREYFETGSSVRNLADIVQYNKDHPETCLPKGECLICQ